MQSGLLFFFKKKMDQNKKKTDESVGERSATGEA